MVIYWPFLNQALSLTLFLLYSPFKRPYNTLDNRAGSASSSLPLDPEECIFMADTANCLHVYFGEAKGKTTASMGLALRACGQGRKVLVAQFLKNNQSGELTALSQLSGIRLLMDEPIQKFTFMMNDAEKQALKAQHTRFLQAIDGAFDEFAPQLMVLDELLVAENKGFVPREVLEPLLDKWLKTCEVVLTGRQISDWLLARANYATEMRKHRHPYDQGLNARKGIEY